MAEKLRPLDQVEMGRRVRSRREAIGPAEKILLNNWTYPHSLSQISNMATKVFQLRSCTFCVRFSM